MSVKRTEFVTLTGKWCAGDAMIQAAAAALAATGEDISDRAQELMVPGHFYDTGLSESETSYQQLTATSGVVHIATDYSAYPEFGTATMEPRPVLGPAIAELWPSRLYEHWESARLAARIGDSRILKAATAIDHASAAALIQLITHPQRFLKSRLNKYAHPIKDAEARIDRYLHPQREAQARLRASIRPHNRSARAVLQDYARKTRGGG